MEKRLLTRISEINEEISELNSKVYKLHDEKRDLNKIDDLIIDILTHSGNYLLYKQKPNLSRSDERSTTSYEVIVNFNMNSRTSYSGGNQELKGDRLIPSQVLELDKIGYRVMCVGDDYIGLSQIN